GKPSLLFKLKTVAEYMKKIKEVYTQYPSEPKELPLWKNKVDSILLDFNKALEK
ncbi:MAG: geranylgeranyl hydrogenase, partial [Saccharolobus sp.]